MLESLNISLIQFIKLSHTFLFLIFTVPIFKAHCSEQIVCSMLNHLGIRAKAYLSRMLIRELLAILSELLEGLTLAKTTAAIVTTITIVFRLL